jgi:CBS domain-containing protein
MMKLKELLDKKGASAVTVPGSSTVGMAIRTMYQNRVGSVIIASDGGTPSGILTERDIMRLYAEGKSAFETLRVEDCMTTNLVLGSPDDEISDVLGIMTEKRFRHMPVVQDKQVVGIVSIGDLVKAKLEETAVEAQALRDSITS